MVTWSLKDLDLRKALEIIPSQDPQTAMRFNLPVPNWLGPDGTPLFTHPQIRQLDDGAWRFFFTNYKDNCLQDVRIDGSSAITFMNVNPGKASQFMALVGEYASDPEHLTPDQVYSILDRSCIMMDLKDRYDNRRSSIERYMHPYPGVPSGHPAFGPVLAKPDISTAVYIQGSGSFADGPTATPQRFETGAFISFPGQRKTALLAMTPAEILASEKFTVKLVQADVFVQSRTYEDGGKINMDALPLQDEPLIKPAASPPQPQP